MHKDHLMIYPKLQSVTLRLNTAVRLLLNPVLCVCFQRQITSWREAIIMRRRCRRYFKIESLYFLWCCIIRRDNAMHSRLCIRQHLDLYSTIKHDKITNPNGIRKEITQEEQHLYLENIRMTDDLNLVSRPKQFLELVVFQHCFFDPTERKPRCTQWTNKLFYVQ